MTDDPRTSARGPADPIESAPFVAANRALWDEWTAIHATSTLYDLDGFRAGGIRLRPYEIDEIGPVLDEQFDVVYTSRGVLGWLPDVTASARSSPP